VSFLFLSKRFVVKNSGASSEAFKVAAAVPSGGRSRYGMGRHRPLKAEANGGELNPKRLITDIEVKKRDLPYIG
jgi:hypothetical protein